MLCVVGLSVQVACAVHLIACIGSFSDWAGGRERAVKMDLARFAPNCFTAAVQAVGEHTQALSGRERSVLNCKIRSD